MGTTQKVRDTTFDAELNQADGLILVDFRALESGIPTR